MTWIQTGIFMKMSKLKHATMMGAVVFTLFAGVSSCAQAAANAEVEMAFCAGVKSDAPLSLKAYPHHLESEAALLNLFPAEQDGDFLINLIDGFSSSSFSMPGEPGSPWPTERALQETARQVALHVRTGNLVSAQIVHLMAAPAWRESVLGQNVARLLRTAYAPYEGMQKVRPEFLPEWAKSLPDEDLKLSLDLAQKQAELLDARGRLGEHFKVPAVRWHLQAAIYNDPVALEVTRQAICSDETLRSSVPAILKQEAAKP